MVKKTFRQIHGSTIVKRVKIIRIERHEKNTKGHHQCYVSFYSETKKTRFIFIHEKGNSKQFVVISFLWESKDLWIETEKGILVLLSACLLH